MYWFHTASPLHLGRLAGHRLQLMAAYVVTLQNALQLWQFLVQLGKSDLISPNISFLIGEREITRTTGSQSCQRIKRGLLPQLRAPVSLERRRLDGHNKKMPSARLSSPFLECPLERIRAQQTLALTYFSTCFGNTKPQGPGGIGVTLI